MSYPQRMMWDPIPYRGYGMLSVPEFNACLRCLRTVEQRTGASVILTWPGDDLDAWVALARMRYVRSTPQNRLELTPAGAAYLRQITDRHSVEIK